MSIPGGGPGPLPRRPIPDLTKHAKNLKKFLIKAEGSTKLSDILVVKKEFELRKIFATRSTKLDKIDDPIYRVKMDRFGDHILVSVINEEQAKLINKITSFAGHKVKVDIKNWKRPK